MSSKKVLKKHWFYRSGNQKRWKTIGFTSRATENVEKPLVLLVKPAPGNGATVRTHRAGVWSSDTRLEGLWGTLTAKLFREKSIGFIDVVRKSVKNALVL